jgi:ParB family chromosome partitioning protein
VAPRTRKVSSPKPRKRRGVKLKPTELTPPELAVTEPPPDVAALARDIEADGGSVLATYREPLGGHVLVFAALPVDKVAPTPFQRDVSDAHVRKLTHAMDKTRRFLDPVIAVREERAGEGEDAQAKYWVPNGFHRLTALKDLGAKSVLALVVPETAVAYQILALNIEKAHNLREKALGVVRMYEDLIEAGHGDDDEDKWALEFEEPALVTLGFAYGARPRLAGGAYHPILRRTESWQPGPLRAAHAVRQARAEALLAFDDAVGEVVARLRARGFQSPYLRAFVVARVNPLRFIKGEAPPPDELLATMTRRARGMDVGRIRPDEIARSGGPPEATDPEAS